MQLQRTGSDRPSVPEVAGWVGAVVAEQIDCDLEARASRSRRSPCIAVLSPPLNAQLHVHVDDAHSRLGLAV